MDLLVGLFAEKNVHNMSDTELVMFNQVSSIPPLKPELRGAVLQQTVW